MAEWLAWVRGCINDSHPWGVAVVAVAWVPTHGKDRVKS